MAFETISLAAQDGVARITLNRPDRLNALTSRMRQELMESPVQNGVSGGLRL